MTESVKPIENGRDNKGKFAKGNSGGGRKPQPKEFRELAEKHCVTALEKVIEIILDPETQKRDQLRAVEILLDRAIGKPVQQTINENFNTSIDESTEETKERLLQLLEELRK